jgi:hypothetical protein
MIKITVFSSMMIMIRPTSFHSLNYSTFIWLMKCGIKEIVLISDQMYFE